MLLVNYLLQIVVIANTLTNIFLEKSEAFLAGALQKLQTFSAKLAMYVVI